MSRAVASTRVNVRATAPDGRVWWLTHWDGSLASATGAWSRDEDHAVLLTRSDASTAAALLSDAARSGTVVDVVRA